MIATAPGKLILTGEYAVLDGAPALVIAVNRRAIARRRAGAPSGSSPFLVAVAAELATRLGADHPAARAALEISVDSSAFYHRMTKLGLGSSAAVTVAATAHALGEPVDRDLVLRVALAAHANAQGARGARGSGADIAASVFGGTIEFAAGQPGDLTSGIWRRKWPTSVTLLPFFTGRSADTVELVNQIAAARVTAPVVVDAALADIAEASRAVCLVLVEPETPATTRLQHAETAKRCVAAFSLAARATDRLAAATGVDLVPACVTAARSAMACFGGTAKTTGAGGGDVAIAVVPASIDPTEATRLLIEAGCQPLQLSVDETGVDTRPTPQ